MIMGHNPYCAQGIMVLVLVHVDDIGRNGHVDKVLGGIAAHCLPAVWSQYHAPS